MDRPRTAGNRAAAIAALLDLPAGARVLDAPCGAGRIAVRLAERGLDVTGIDIHVYTTAELVRMLEHAGFTHEQLLGDPAARTAFELGSKRLVVIARAR
jgi:cyclopropane fatty-acyl-phospholipid synthase-like methyltransferase